MSKHTSTSRFQRCAGGSTALRTRKKKKNHAHSPSLGHHNTSIYLTICGLIIAGSAWDLHDFARSLLTYSRAMSKYSQLECERNYKKIEKKKNHKKHDDMCITQVTTATTNTQVTRNTHQTFVPGQDRRHPPDAKIYFSCVRGSKS